MKSLNKKQGIAVFVSLAVLAYLFFAGPIMSLFSPSVNNANEKNMIETGYEAEDVTTGTGEVAQKGDLVSAHYVGRLTNGQVFDSSKDRGEPIQFVLGSGQVIRGWDEGIVGMKEGGKRILTIAPDFGYGANAIGPIPANSVLVFEVELVGVQKP
jgi:FKBP-type peptidyl-prolyl cis-trans isomerase